jgi:Protein of unknown function (DUF2905)
MSQEFPLYSIGKFLVVAGVALTALGAIIMAGARFSFFGLGKLPGDLTYRGKHATVYFPIVTSLVLSVLLTLIVWLISWLTRH